MGFGWLFLGYFIANFMSLHQFGAICRLVGYAVMLASAIRLRRYHRAFFGVAIASCVMILLSGTLSLGSVELFAREFLLTETDLLPDALQVVLGHAEQWMTLVFGTALLWAIRLIAIETEVNKIAVGAVRNFVFMSVYYLVYAVSLLPIPMNAVSGATVAIVAWIFFFAHLILNQVLLFSCYAKICDENDVEMERKPSRFSFVNEFRAESDRRENRAREADARYREEKKKKRMEKANRRKK